MKTPLSGNRNEGMAHLRRTIALSESQKNSLQSSSVKQMLPEEHFIVTLNNGRSQDGKMSN